MFKANNPHVNSYMPRSRYTRKVLPRVAHARSHAKTVPHPLRTIHINVTLDGGFIYSDAQSRLPLLLPLVRIKSLYNTTQQQQQRREVFVRCYICMQYGNVQLSILAGRSTGEHRRRVITACKSYVRLCTVALFTNMPGVNLYPFTLCVWRLWRLAVMTVAGAVFSPLRQRCATAPTPIECAGATSSHAYTKHIIASLIRAAGMQTVEIGCEDQINQSSTRMRNATISGP